MLSTTSKNLRRFEIELRRIKAKLQNCWKPMRYLRKSKTKVFGSDILSDYLERLELLELIRHIVWNVDRY